MTHFKFRHVIMELFHDQQQAYNTLSNEAGGVQVTSPTRMFRSLIYLEIPELFSSDIVIFTF